MFEAVFRVDIEGFYQHSWVQGSNQIFDIKQVFLSFDVDFMALDDV